MPTLTIDGVNIAEINSGIAEQLKHLARKGAGLQKTAPLLSAGIEDMAAELPKVTCIITLEFPGEAARP